MGRKPNYSTEELIKMIEEYVQSQESARLLSPTDIERFCKSRYALPHPVTYQTFTRNHEVMNYICKYNADLEASVIGRGKSDLIPDFAIDVNAIIDGGLSTDQIRSILSSANGRLDKMSSIISDKQTELKKANAEISRLLKENRELSSQLSELSARRRGKSRSAMEDLVRRHKEEKARLTSFIKEHITDPVLLNKIREYSLEDSVDTHIKNEESLLVAEDVIGAATAYFGEDNETEDDSSAEIQEAEEIEFISTAETEVFSPQMNNYLADLEEMI